MRKGGSHMRIVKIGIIGCGVISHTYIMNIKTMYTWLNILACADLSLTKAQKVAHQYDIPKACTPEELLKIQDIEIVINLTVPSVHASVNQKILQAGKHVYCEKPLALNMEDAKKTLEVAKEYNRMLACAPETFLGAGLQTCRKIIDEGWIGRPLSMTANMMSYGVETWHASPEFYYKKGGGPMMDMGPYYITALVALLGPISHLACFQSKGEASRTIYSEPLRGQKINVDVSTTYTGIIQFSNQLIGNINMSFDVWHSNLPMLEIYGTQGTLTIPDPNMFGGKIQLLRKESVMDSVQVKTFNENLESDMKKQVLAYELPQLYSQPLENMRGLGVLDMAFALVNGRKHRVDESLAYHVTEALIGFDKSAESGMIYKMQSTCERPKPLPVGQDFNALD